MRKLEMTLITVFGWTVFLTWVVGAFTIESYTDGINIIAKYVLIVLCGIGSFWIFFRARKKDENLLGMCLSVALFTWLLYLLSAATLKKLDVLTSALRHKTTTQTLPLANVAERKGSHGGFKGGEIAVLYDGDTLQFDVSRYNYYLLEGKKEMQADFGQTFTGRYFITKIYASDANISVARERYNGNWWQRNYYWIYILAAAAALSGIFLWRNKRKGEPTTGDHYKRAFLQLLLLLFGGALLIIGLIIGAMWLFAYLKK